MSLPESVITVARADAACTVVCGDSREELKVYRGRADLIATSPPYAHARRRHSLLAEQTLFPPSPPRRGEGAAPKRSDRAV